MFLRPTFKKRKFTAHLLPAKLCVNFDHKEAGKNKNRPTPVLKKKINLCKYENEQ